MSPRPYRSAAREAQSARTRERILAEALPLFLAGGFRGTSLTAIARAAGTTSQTIHTHFGSKSGILLALLQQLETTADAEGWRQRVASAPSGRERLVAWAGWSVAMLAPARRLASLMQEASADPAMRELKEMGDQHRRAGVRALAEQMAVRGELRPGIDADRAADELFILTGLEVYLTAASCGWDDEHIAQWLADLLGRQLLP
ncbi:TetR/AcrR family transcriptional regulator [Aestuariimicrobium sp. p3-SID1156]|uniref:TetR/AcrR family transcriptional regulator n=1 Tax=Aestuariimicrobium sp. p3-SID1156 TaxID=2916038 RepID=UPI00223C40B5|nr:TetR/AcrR family transcriptional regulator [Aestuariimicrobium sp. p3-SID1156]MCT1457945.1 TetR/AcrR family transcriptional regulator [Aestuariimicrobium sp. p3-SID1156]